MTTADSDWYELGDRSNEPFNLTRVSITGGAETAETMGRFLLDGLSDLDYLGKLLAQGGYTRVSEYVQQRRVPTKLNIRVANFGEVVSGHLLEEEEDLLRPIEKLRYTFNHEWSPHLTDVFAVQIEDDEVISFAYCEVKAGTTHPANDVGAKGYKDLVKAWREKTPEILHFTAERLFEAKRFEEYERLYRAMYSATPVSQLLRLVLVFDEAAWADSVLEAVEAAVAQDAPPDDSFVCYVATRADLRTLVHDSFEMMAKFAEQP